MLIHTDDIREFRPVAENLDDVSRLEPYVKEVENLRIIDVLGASLYQWLDGTDFNGEGPFVYVNPRKEEVTITKDQYIEIMRGGYFTSDCGDCSGGNAPGLIAAISYLTYARFLINNPITVTAFGVKYKTTQYSQNVDDYVLIRASNDARKIGEAYLAKSVEQLKAFGLLDCRKYRPNGKYHAFGKKGI